MIAFSHNVVTMRSSNYVETEVPTLLLLLFNVDKIIIIIIIRLEMFDDDHLDPFEMLFKTLRSKNQDLQRANPTESGNPYRPTDLPWHVGTSNPR